MIKLRSLALSATAVIAIIAIVAICFSARLKLFLTASHSPSITASIAMENDHLLVGQKPRAILTIKNNGSGYWAGFGDPENYLVHVEGESGEPPKRGLEFTRPGFEDDLSGLPSDTSRTMKWELSSFYKLNAPGKYTVYFEIQEEPGVWLRTDNVQFQILATAQ